MNKVRGEQSKIEMKVNGVWLYYRMIKIYLNKHKHFELEPESFKNVF